MYKEKNLLEKVSTNLVGYLLQFVNHKDVFTCGKVNKKFHKALNSEYLWETLVLQNELFVSGDRNSFTNWKNLYLSLHKLKSNLKGGKPNIGFKMKPMRGHTSYIVSAVVYEVSGKFGVNKIISADKEGNVFHWIVNEDEDYENVLLAKFESQVIDMRIIKKEELDYKERENINSDVLLITEKNSVTYGNIFNKFLF
jgi:hypothetical protein